MSRMFHRVLATSVIGAAALAAPVTAMAADTGGGGGSGTEPAPTAVVVHLPKHVEPGQAVTVTARVTTPEVQPGGPGTDKPGQGGDDHSGKGHQHKGPGHGKKHKKHHGKRRHAVTGKVEFFLDGKPETPVEVSHGRASERLEIPVGKHTIFAQYSGDDEHLAAKSAPVTFDLTADQQGQDDQPGAGGDQKGSGGATSTASVQNGERSGAVGPLPGDEDPDNPGFGQDCENPPGDQGWDDSDQDDQCPGQDTPNQSGDEDQI